MVTSRKEVEQAVGRVIRKVNPNVRPLIFDMTDQLSSFINQGRNRRKLYKKMGFEIKITDVQENIIIKEEIINEFINIKESNIGCDFID